MHGWRYYRFIGFGTLVLPTIITGEKTDCFTQLRKIVHEKLGFLGKMTKKYLANRNISC